MRDFVLALLCAMLGIILAIAVKTGVDYVQYNISAALGIPYVATSR